MRSDLTRAAAVRRLGTLAALAALAALVGAVPVTDTPAAGASGFTLPLGDDDLTEHRTVTPLATGVQLLRIVRGATPAPPGSIGTTSRGPWRVSVLTIDPKRARGHLRATYGRDLAQTEHTSALTRSAGGLAGVNASFFTFGKNPQHPGDPVGLSLYRGAVLSEPAAVRPEVDLVVDAKRNTVRIGRLTWSGTVKNRRSGKSLRLEHLNHPPVVPSRCSKLTDPTACRTSGDVVHFSSHFGPTPAGSGVEVVLDRSGCVVKRARTRGTALAAGQTSVQATGRETVKLLAFTRKGCLTRTVKLYDEKKRKLKLHGQLYGVAGRYRLTRSGRVVVPTPTGAFFARHPRTIAGTTADGRIVLATIDGRRTTSVGTTLAETAAVASALGMADAVNLDGGGSTAMSVRGAIVNQLSGSTERAVGDALVYVDRPL